MGVHLFLTTVDEVMDGTGVLKLRGRQCSDAYFPGGVSARKTLVRTQLRMIGISFNARVKISDGVVLVESKEP